MCGRDEPRGRPFRSSRPAVAPWHNREIARLRSVVLGDRVPVHDVPPRLEVIGPAVLVLQVIRVLPHIDAKDRSIAVHQRTVLIWRGDYFEAAVLVLD